VLPAMKHLPARAVITTPIPRRVEGLRAGNAIVDQAIADGLSSVSDFAALGAATRELSGEERAQIMARLAVAINADRVRLDQSRRPP
jgi:hypothetical protein